MADQKKEWISALADDELQGVELDRALDALRDDRAMQLSWSRYHLMRDALHSNLEEGVDAELHLRISEALDKEPVVLAPQPVVKRSWLKHAAGLAVAASVTGVAVLAVQQMGGQEPAAPTPTMAEVMKPDNVVRIDTTAVARAEEGKPQGNDKLAPYLVNHNEYSVSSGMHGMLPYVRVVGHGEEQ